MTSFSENNKIPIASQYFCVTLNCARNILIVTYIGRMRTLITSSNILGKNTFTYVDCSNGYYK